MGDAWSRCMMASPPSSRELPVGGSGRPLFVSTALFAMTLLLIYLIILFPRPFLFTTEPQVIALLPKQEAQTQTTIEVEDEYSHLNDTNSRLQIPLFNLPYLYKVRFKLYMPWESTVSFGSKNWSTDSYSIMHFTVQKTNKRLQVHAVNLHIGEVYIKDDMDRNITIKEICRDFPHVLDIHTEHELIENMNYSLHIHYIGKILLGKGMHAVHASPYMEDDQIKHIVSTHCQTQEARKVLPCIDVPEAKAKFLVIIVHPVGTSATSNSKENGHSHDGDWITTTFEPSPFMSTYLLAFAVGAFPFIQTEYKDIRIRVYAEQSKLADAQLALQTIPLVIEKLEEYFTIPIPLNKLDVYEVPQLSPIAAMENWGLITTEEKGLFFKNNFSSYAERYNVLVTMAHEITHQWFGNLVTMKWWNELWLNEGFATMIGTKVLERLGEYQFDNVTKLAGHLRNEVGNPTAISRKENPTFEPNSMFATAYYKPALIMKMIEAIVGEEYFRLGVIRFLKRFAYSNADHEDLMEALSYAHDSQSGNQFSGQDFSLTNVIESWIYQKGYPIIHLASREDGMVVASQQPCLAPPRAKIENQRWLIPLFIRDPVSLEHKVEWLTDNKTTVFDLGEDLVLDGYVYSFARIRYDNKLYKRIVSALKTDKDRIPVNSRSRLVDDLFTAAEYGDVEYSTVFNLASYLANETAFNPVVMFSAHLDLFYSRLNVCPKYHILKQYVAAIFGPIFLRHQATPTSSLSSAEAHMQDVVCKRACGVGYIPCITAAKAALSNVKNECGDEQKLSSRCNSIPNHLKRCYYAANVMFGDQEEFDYLYSRYIEETNADEKTDLWIGLSASKRKDDIWKVWDHFLFNRLQWINFHNYRTQCSEFSKYYHADPNFTSFVSENAERIVNVLSRPELDTFLNLFGRCFFDVSEKPQFMYVANIALKKYSPLQHANPSRLDQVSNFRKYYSDQIFDILTDELKTLEPQPILG